MKFLIVIGKNVLHTYIRDNEKYKIQFIEGSEEFVVNTSRIESEIQYYLESLANENNLDTIALLKFDVIYDDENHVSSLIVNQLKEYIELIRELKTEITKVMIKLKKDKKLKIEEYGINFAGNSYKLKHGEMARKEDYDLLSYSISMENLANLL